MKFVSLNSQQVSQWTPDLIQLEHRAKEKARVLFFVMDSETRASAGAIEAAHIAGQNIKPLILVLHPYKRNQKILNENISEEWVNMTSHTTNINFITHFFASPHAENSSTFRAIRNCWNNLSHDAACLSLTTYSRACKRSKALLRVKDHAICHSQLALDSCELPVLLFNNFLKTIDIALKWN